MWVNNLGYYVDGKERDLKVEIHGLKNGLLEFSLIAGDQRFDTHFRHDSDPIRDIRSWLESLSTNVYQATLYYNMNNHSVLWRCTYATIFVHVMEVLQYDRNGEQRMMTFNASRHQVIKVIYETFLKFFASDRYDHGQWQEERLRERLMRQYGMENDELCEYLARFNTQELGKILFHAGYEYLLTEPEAEEPREKRLGLLAALKSGIPWEGPILESFGIELLWPIDKDYEIWPFEQKACRIESYLLNPATEFLADNPRLLRSQIVDAYFSPPEEDLF